MSEQDILRRIIDNAAKGQSIKNSLKLDPYSKCIRPSGYVDPDAGLWMQPEDTKFSVNGGL